MVHIDRFKGPSVVSLFELKLLIFTKDSHLIYLVGREANFPPIPLHISLPFMTSSTGKELVSLLDIMNETTCLHHLNLLAKEGS